jgi:iron complex transport system substrate-binding protein
MKKKIFLLLTVFLMFTMFASGCSNTAKTEGTLSKETGTRIITDAVGREVEIPETVIAVVPLANALRMMCYADALDLVVGIELGETEKNIVKAYNWVNYDTFTELPVVGEGGSGGYTPYEEEIVQLNPDVIICGYSQEDAENLQRKTGIPVVVVNGGTLFGEDYDESLKIIGEVCNKEKRCEEVIEFIKGIKEDLNNRTANVTEENKPVVYTGAVSFKGGHGIEGTYINFPPFTALNATDIFGDTEAATKGVVVEKEKILTADPDIIFLDPNNISLVKEDYTANKDFYNSLTAVKNDKLYTMLGYNYYYTNVEIALADCYYAGTVIYPNEFSDINPEEKANKIFSYLIGSDTYYQELTDVGLGFSKINLGE